MFDKVIKIPKYTNVSVKLVFRYSRNTEYDYKKALITHNNNE